MQIAILGAGNIGTTLGKKWRAAGHEVCYGVRDVAKYQHLNATSIAHAIAVSEVILVSMPASAVEGLVQEHKHLLDGKIIIDVTNRFDEEEVSNIPTFQRRLPDVMLFRAFNSLGWEVFEDPVVNGTQVDHFFCGPDGDAKLKVEQLIRDVGLNPVYVGELNMRFVVDRLGSLWVTLAFQRGLGRRLGFKMVRE